VVSFDNKKLGKCPVPFSGPRHMIHWAWKTAWRICLMAYSG